jgi:hypothetical protein
MEMGLKTTMIGGRPVFLSGMAIKINEGIADNYNNFRLQKLKYGHSTGCTLSYRVTGFL